VTSGAAVATVTTPVLDAPATRRDGPIRVAQVVTKLSAGAGGITLRGALALDPARYSTTILAGQCGPLADRAEQAGIDVIRLRHMAPGRRINPWVDVQGVREVMTHLAAGDFDLVHTHSSRAGALGRIAARRIGVPALVHSFHGFPFHEFQSVITRHVVLAIERRLSAITDFFVTDGTVVAAEAVRLKLAPPERVRAIASPIDSDIRVVSEASRREARRLLGLPESAKVVGTAARLQAQKAPLTMVKAIALLGRDDVYMVWIGDGELRAKAERLAAKLGLGDRVLMLGDRTDVARLLPALDVFAMSSLFEGLPCALVEAMTCGIPVVATAVNSVPEIVVSGKTGLLARPADAGSLSRALGHMLDHPAEAERMASAARVHLGERFRPDVLGADLMDVYESALAFARAGVPARWASAAG
jgi:glycosyltransferase involved in cell wall biosynthesis